MFPELLVVATALLASFGAARALLGGGGADVATAWNNAAAELGDEQRDAQKRQWIETTLHGHNIQLRPQHSCTEVSTTMVAPPGFHLEVHRKLPSVLAEEVRTSVVSLGDAYFDAHYVVVSNDQRLARYWLSAETRKRIDQLTGFRITLIEGRLSALHVGLVNKTRALVDAAEVVCLLADVADQLDASWRQLGQRVDADGYTTKTAWQGVNFRMLGLALEVRMRHTPDGLFSEVSTPLAGHPRSPFILSDHHQTQRWLHQPTLRSGRYSLWVDEGHESPAHTASLVEQLHAQKAAALLVSGNEATVRWRTFLPTTEQLEQAVEMLQRSLISENQGPYR